MKCKNMSKKHIFQGFYDFHSFENIYVSKQNECMTSRCKNSRINVILLKFSVCSSISSTY